MERTSNQWLFMEKIDALWSIATQTELTMPINFDRTIMEQIESDLLWNQESSDDIYDFYSLPNNELNIMTISHLYTMNNFGQLGQSELFSYHFRNNLYLGGVHKDFQSCFEEISYGYYGNENQGTLV